MPTDSTIFRQIATESDIGREILIYSHKIPHSQRNFDNFRHIPANINLFRQIRTGQTTIFDFQGFSDFSQISHVPTNFPCASKLVFAIPRKTRIFCLTLRKFIFKWFSEAQWLQFDGANYPEVVRVFIEAGQKNLGYNCPQSHRSN